jgi:two-component system sensor histidine kinase HydH
MTAEQLQAIFTPYFTTKADGTGLGWRWCRTLSSSTAERFTPRAPPARGAIYFYLPVNGQQKDEQG